MKKIISISVAILLFTLLPLSVFASSNQTTALTEQKYITYLDDGSYYVTTITTNSAALTTAAATSDSSVSADKTKEYYNSSGTMLWKVVLKGKFTYNGTSSTCTSASYSVTIYDNAWYKYSGNAYTSGNKALADVVMKQKFLGVVVATKNVNLTLACDKNGNLS